MRKQFPHQNADCSLKNKFIVSFIIIFGTLPLSSHNTSTPLNTTLFQTNNDSLATSQSLLCELVAVLAPDRPPATSAGKLSHTHTTTLVYRQ